MKNNEATETTQAAAVAEQGAHVAPEKAPSKKGASQKKGAPKGQKTAKGAKAKAAAEEGSQGRARRPPSPTTQRSQRPARREQGRENPGHDRTRQGRHPRRDHEGHRLAGPQRPGFHLHRRQEARRQHRVLEERSGRPRLQYRQVETSHCFPSRRRVQRSGGAPCFFSLERLHLARAMRDRAASRDKTYGL